MDYTSLVGILGSGLLLLAFFLASFKKMPWESRAYFSMNLAGAILLAYAAVLIDYYPFIILEGAWGTVAFIGLAKTYRKK